MKMNTAEMATDLKAFERTTPPGSGVVLYEGNRKFCTAQSKNLAARSTRRGANGQLPGTGILEQFPGVSYEAYMKAMHLITPDGQIYRGFEAAVRVPRRHLFPACAPTRQLENLPGVLTSCGPPDSQRLRS